MIWVGGTTIFGNTQLENQSCSVELSINLKTLKPATVLSKRKTLQTTSYIHPDVFKIWGVIYAFQLQRLTWNQKMIVFKKGLIVRFHVKLQKCKPLTRPGV